MFDPVSISVRLTHPYMDTVYYSQVGISVYKNIANMISHTTASHAIQNPYMECGRQHL